MRAQSRRAVSAWRDRWGRDRRAWSTFTPGIKVPSGRAIRTYPRASLNTIAQLSHSVCGEPPIPSVDQLQHHALTGDDLPRPGTTHEPTQNVRPGSGHHEAIITAVKGGLHDLKPLSGGARLVQRRFPAMYGPSTGCRDAACRRERPSSACDPSSSSPGIAQNGWERKNWFFSI
jgi:hypothetical protein